MTSFHVEAVLSPTRGRLEYAAALENLRAQVGEAGAESSARRLGDLADRLRQGDLRLRVALCGLFSAGKSSLINALTGDAGLATGAVPTTAEVQPVTWPSPGGEIILMDTPGIDSTDDAHQAATDAAMHLADLVLLVMDYQHVEAEENLEFARRLAARGKRVCVVVNQIDKHLDFELRFDTYRARVEAALEEEGIACERLFYTTSRSSPYNELDALRAFLAAEAQAGERGVLASILSTACGLVDDAIAELYSGRQWEADNHLLDVCGRTPLDEAEAESWLRRADARLADDRAEKEQARASWLASWLAAVEGFDRTVELAQIAPYATTELGRAYVQSLRKDFKVGWLGAERKTAEERTRRLHAFQEDLAKTLRHNLIWPLQRELRAFVYDTEGADERWVAELEKLDVPVPETELTGAVNRGAIESNQYPYQYVKDVVGRLKGDVRRELHRLVDSWQADALQRMEQTAQAPSPELAAVAAEAEALREWLRVRAEQRQQRSAWLACLQGGVDRDGSEA